MSFLTSRTFGAVTTASVLFTLTALPGQTVGESAEARQRLQWWSQHVAMESATPYTQSWQFVGPVQMTGRVTDIEAHPSAPKTIYVTTASGGVFKSTDEGESWTPIFEDYPTASIGDMAIAPTNPDIVWIGTGEANILRSSMAGTGVYKSTDAGRSFTHMGLTDTHHIGRILIHPQDPDTVYVAAAGHEYTLNEERGVYKTTDGGQTWRKVFYQDEKTAVIDLAMDPTAPDTLYAGTAPRLRYRWNDPKPGPESGLYKSTDGGATWARLGGGLPDFASGEYERVGVTVCATQPNTVYTVLNHQGGARGSNGAELYRSDDKGGSWKLVEGNDAIRGLFPGYGWFFGQVRVDPNDADTVYVMGVSYRGSDDGGVTWDREIARGHSDYHAMWINPTDSNHVLVGNDGGILISHDKLETAARPRNLPISQPYNVAVSMEQGGFWAYLACQDNGAWRGFVDLSNGRNSIIRQEWSSAAGDEAGRHAVDPTNPDIVYSVSRYGGGLARTDYGTPVVQEAAAGGGRRRHNSTPIQPDFGDDRKRAQWVSPLILSPHDPNRVLYGAQFVFLSDDRGDNWRRISPDLTNVHPDRQGNIAHAIVFAISESPVEKGVIYAGTDDGNVQVTRNEGETWKNINAGLPEGRVVANIEASHFDAGTVFITVNGKRHNDFECYVYKSTDYGETWERISGNIPGSPANVVKQDPANKDLLYVGTDRAVYVTTNGGENWEVLGADLPTAYVHDLVIQTVEDYAVIATHGRGIFVLDIRELRQS